MAMELNEENMKIVLDKAMDEIADIVFVKSQENIKRYGAIDTGNMMGSGNVHREFMKKSIVYDAPYTGYVEFGTPPHSISPEGEEAILRWVNRKIGVSGKEGERIANAIIWKIRMKGTQPRPFMRDAMNEIANKSFKIDVVI